MSAPTRPPTASRREFLLGAGALALAPSALLRPARPEGSPLLLAIYLRGGADFLNMVVPWKDRDYRRVRPTIGLGQDEGVVPLDGDFALHPALAPLEPLWDARQLAPVLCVGSPHPTRSHFDAQDFMERAAPGLRHVTSGWLNRYLVATRARGSSEFRAVALQGLLPRALRGEYPALAVPPGLDREQSEATLGEFEELYGGSAGMEPGAAAGSEVLDSGRATIETLRRFHAILAAAKPAADAGYPRSAFGQRLRAVAALVRADCGLEVAAIDYPGWDHHINQGAAAGTQARMLADYAASLAAFCADLGPRLERTLVLTLTEFGRTVAENGNSGTDHGRGGGALLLGGGVRGGRVHGSWRGLEQDDLVDGRDLPVTTDFRDVMAACLEAALGFDPPRGFFPEHKPRRLALF